MREKNFQTAFNRWLKYNWDMTAVFELKLCKQKSFPLSALKEHQINALKVAGRKFIYKIPDSAEGQKPCDCIFIAGSPGYLVIMYYRRGQKKFYIIEISQIEKEIKSGSKSLTEERANSIAYKMGELR